MQARDTRVTVQLLPDEVVRRWWWHRHSPGPPTIHAMGAWGLVYWVPADSERMNWRFLFLGSDSQAGIHRRSDGRQHARTGMLARHTDTDGYGGGTMHPGSRTTWSAAPPAPRATERSTSTCRPSDLDRTPRAWRIRICVRVSCAALGTCLLPLCVPCSIARACMLSYAHSIVGKRI
jgi:hypothetical protein